MWTVEAVKQRLPNVTVTWAGKRWQANLSGPDNHRATVRPFWQIGAHYRQAAIVGPLLDFSWEAVVDALNHGNDLKGGEA